MKASPLYMVLSLFLILILGACAGDEMEVVVPNQDELITTLILTFEDTNTHEKATWIFTDIDGVGGQPPEYSTQSLKSNTNYQMKMELLNEYATPTINVTEEVEEEGDEHQFFFISDNLTVQYEDEDINGHPIGLIDRAKTAGTGEHRIRIVLRHQPSKNIVSVQNGDISEAGGESDLDVEFNYMVE